MRPGGGRFRGRGQITRSDKTAKQGRGKKAARPVKAGRDSFLRESMLPASVEQEVDGMIRKMAALDETGDAGPVENHGRRPPHFDDRPDRPFRQPGGLGEIRSQNRGVSAKDAENGFPGGGAVQAPPGARAENWVDDPGDVRAPGQQPADLLEVFGRAGHPDLPAGRDFVPFQGPDLVPEKAGREGNDAKDVLRVLSRHGREDGRGLETERSEDGRVGQNARASGGIESGDRDKGHDALSIPPEERFVNGAGRKENSGEGLNFID